VIFAHDTETALVAAAALVNTGPAASHTGDDELATVDQLVRYLDAHGFTGVRAGTGSELDTVRELRSQLRALWGADRDSRVDLVNEMLRDGDALPQLVRHDGWDWHLHATEATAPLATRLRVEAAMAFTDVIRSGEDERIRICAADDCDAVLVDLSRNRSKRYCDVGNCGNRMNVNAYRARRAASG